MYQYWYYEWYSQLMNNIHVLVRYSTALLTTGTVPYTVEAKPKELTEGKIYEY